MSVDNRMTVLHEEASAVCPIAGVRSSRGVYSADVAESATPEQLNAIATLLAEWNALTPQQLQAKLDAEEKRNRPNKADVREQFQQDLDDIAAYLAITGTPTNVQNGQFLTRLARMMRRTLRRLREID